MSFPRAGGDMTQENFLSGTPAHENRQHPFQMLLGIGVLVVGRQLHGQAQGHAAGNNGDLVHRVSARSHCRHDGVASFVICGILFLLVGENQGLALDAHQHFVLGHFKIFHQHKLAVSGAQPTALLHWRDFPNPRRRSPACRAR